MCTSIRNPIKNPIKEAWVFFAAAAVIFNWGLLVQAPLAGYIVAEQIVFVLFLGVTAFYFYQQRRQWRSPVVLVSAFIFIFFLWHGAYLEYPADPWEYFRLVTEWQNKTNFSQFPHRYGRFWLDPPRFNYFFYWAQMWFLPRTSWRGVMDVISAATMTLAFVQIYELAKEFCENKTQALWMAVFGFVFTGVYNLNSFYSLALSANILSFIFFYRCLQPVVRWVKGDKSNEIYLLVPLSLLILATHVQGMLWLAETAFAVALYWFFYPPARFKNFKPARWMRWTVMGLVAVGSSYLLLRHGQEFQADWFSEKNTFVHTLARPGLIALLVGFFWRRQMPLLWIFSLTPVVLVCVPLFSYPLFKYLLPISIYGHRLFYLLPTGFIVYYVLNIFLKGKRPEFLFTGIFLVLLSADPRSPWFGRLHHLINPTPPELNYKNAEQMAFWMDLHRPQIRHCRYATDQYTDFLLTTYFGWELRNPRVTTRFDNYFEDRMLHMDEDPNYCGIIIKDWNHPETIPISAINHELHHWSENENQAIRATTPDLKLAVNNFLQRHWRSSPIANGYILIEPPVGDTTKRGFVGYRQ